MMKRFFRKMFMILGVVFFCSAFIGCEKNKDDRQNKIENDDIKEALFNYKFD